MAVVDREQYFAAAMDILAADGPGALTVSALCRRFDVTVGSFYHHFRGVDGFVDALLEHWGQQQTLRIIELSGAPTDPAERVRLLRELALTVPHEAEAAIRSWAASNPRVASAQARVDSERQDALTAIVRGVVPDDERAALLAVLGMSLLVGMQQLRRPFDVAELARVLAEFEQTVYRHAGELRRDR